MFSEPKLVLISIALPIPSRTLPWMACQSMHDSVIAWLVEGADVERELDDIGNPAVDHWGDMLPADKFTMFAVSPDQSTRDEQS